MIIFPISRILVTRTAYAQLGLFAAGNWPGTLLGLALVLSRAGWMTGAVCLGSITNWAGWLGLDHHGRECTSPCCAFNRLSPFWGSWRCR